MKGHPHIEESVCGCRIDRRSNAMTAVCKDHEVERASEIARANAGLHDIIDESIALALDMMRLVGPEREESDAEWRALCEKARYHAGVHPKGL